MLKNYFKSSWRFLSRNKFSSLINIGGLAVGMAVAFLIALWIYDELSYNKYHKNYKRVARVMQHQTTNGIVYSGQAMPFPLAAELRTTYKDDFKYVVMTSWMGDHILTYGDKVLSKVGSYMEKDAAKMLSLKMIVGSQDGLTDMNSILLSASGASAFFGNEDPLNKVIRIDNNSNVKVTGVFEDLPHNSDFNGLSFILPFDLYVANQPSIQRSKDQWDNNSFQLFAQISDNTDFQTVDRKIIASKQEHVAPVDKKYDSKVFLHPMADWHLRSHWDDNGIKTGGLIEYVWLFSIIGAFVLLLACINFMNLSTAQSEKRAKEVGIRKTIGSARSQLIKQFYSESILVVVFAFAVSIVLVWIGLPFFNGLSNKQMLIPWGQGFFWIAAAAFILITAIIAGSYPAYYLSSFRPIKVLKGTFKTGRLASLPRKVLVVLQFTVSVALIIGTIVVYSQVQHSKSRPVGYNRNRLIMSLMKSDDFYGKFDLLRNELKNSGAIVEFAETSSPLTGIWSYNDGISWPGKDPNLDVGFATIWGTHEYGKTLGWQLTHGRDFSRQFATDSSGVVINEAAVKFMGIKDPVGTVITWQENKYTVLGVIKDMIMISPYEPVKETLYFLDYNNVNWIVMKLDPNRSASESIAKIEATFKKYIPSAPFDYKFADTEFAEKFAAEERIGKLSTFLAALAIFISCLGLFGLTSFVAEQRKKEIGVRKVLGATVLNVWRLLSKEFVILVFISLFLAIPVTYYYMNEWLMRYNYRVGLSWWIFAAAGGGTMLITLLTVSFQSIKAAISNPVKSLRTE